MIVRSASPADVTAIKQCVVASLQAAYGGLWTTEPLTPRGRDWGGAGVACSSGSIIGVGLSERDAISDLWFHPAKQGRGARTALLQALEDEIARRGFETARLRCLEPNLKARSFYVSRGWTEIRVYPHEAIPLNTVDMTKAVSSGRS